MVLALYLLQYLSVCFYFMSNMHGIEKWYYWNPNFVHVIQVWHYPMHRITHWKKTPMVLAQYLLHNLSVCFYFKSNIYDIEKWYYWNQMFDHVTHVTQV